MYRQKKKRPGEDRLQSSEGTQSRTATPLELGPSGGSVASPTPQCPLGDNRHRPPVSRTREVKLLWLEASSLG